MKQRELLKKGKIIGDFGCYFLSLLWRQNNREVDFNDIFLYYDLFVKKHYMDEDCYVLDPAAILSFITSHRWTIKMSKTYDESADFAIAKYHNPKTGLSHFVVATPEKVLYDPLGYSNTVSGGYIESWRLFYIEHSKTKS